MMAKFKNSGKWIRRLTTIVMLIYGNVILYECFMYAQELVYYYADVKAMMANENAFDHHSNLVNTKLQIHFDVLIDNSNAIKHYLFVFGGVSLIVITIILINSLVDLLRGKASQSVRI